MAEAKRIKRTVKVVTTLPGYQLELSEGDADFLLALLSRSHGHGKKSPNKYRNRILEALKAVTGMDPADTEAVRHLDRGTVRWKHYDDPDAGKLRVQTQGRPLHQRALEAYFRGELYPSGWVNALRPESDYEQHDLTQADTNGTSER